MATALQMITWGVKVNDYGNAILDESGEFAKVPGNGVGDDVWAAMKAKAGELGLKGGNYKKLNLPFENTIMSQEQEIRDRSAKAVEDFVYTLLTDVFNAGDTADLAYQTILEAGSHDPGPKAGRIDDPADWTEERIKERAKSLGPDKGPEGNFDD